MRVRRSCFPLAILSVVLALPTPAAALSISLIDTFEDGTSENWFFGGVMGPVGFPIVVMSDGPAGAGDAHMLLVSTGLDVSGGRLTILNDMQWAGDYLALGITAIAMDVNNLGNSDLALRLMFEDPALGPPTNIAFSSDPILVPSGSDWTRIVFPITPASLTAGLGTIEAALSGATILRLYHSAADTFPNPGGIPGFPQTDPIAAEIGVDNIQVVVPEPATMALFAFGVAALCARRARRRI